MSTARRGSSGIGNRLAWLDVVATFIGLLGDTRELIERGFIDDDESDRPDNSHRCEDRQTDSRPALAVRCLLGTGISGLALLATRYGSR
jgi:hypothetical protein